MITECGVDRVGAAGEQAGAQRAAATAIQNRAEVTLKAPRAGPEEDVEVSSRKLT